MRQACNSWWGEAKSKGIPNNLVLTKKLLSTGVGHFTQMAWANTNKIGCSVVRCPKSEWKTYVVCQYNPPFVSIKIIFFNIF